MQLILVFLSAALVNNLVLARSLGVCPFIGVSKQLKASVGMGAAVTVVMVIASAATFAIFNLVLVPFDVVFLHIIVFIFLIAGLVQLIEMFLKKYVQPLHKALGIYLPLITTNCAVLGIVLLNIETFSDSILYTLAHGLGGGIGFTLALTLFAGIREKMEKNDSIPKALKGLPITMIVAGLMSIAFLGFAGMITL
jgi:electron transport complex protein RnfA